MDRNLYHQRLLALREQLTANSLDGFVVPLSDEHMSEYVGSYAQRLEWLTGFNGSAGSAVVLQNSAAIFVDGRYTLQVRDQVDGADYAYQSVPETSVAAWLGEHAATGAKIGYDAWLHGKGWVKAASAALAKCGAELVAVTGNPIDAVWPDRPAPSSTPAVVHHDALAGQSSAEKCAKIAAQLAEQGCDAAVITALDSLAWLFNIRGSDVSRTPVALAFAVLHNDASADLFIAPEKVMPALRDHLGPSVRLQPRDAFLPALAALADKVVLADPDCTVQAIFTALAAAGAQVHEGHDPCILPKACKNATEQAGHRAAQARDSAAMARFLHWLSIEAPANRVDEISAAERLHQCRRDTGSLRDLSFDTISGSGPNGAIVHYRVSPETNRPLHPNSVYLVDSGGQYQDGTTDITRTVWIGPDAAPAEIRQNFTLVLKGHIALASAQFPKGTTGGQLDVLARQHLWAAGLDYAHGTGHGVGAYLSVHEGPQRIGKAGSAQELLPGMILSDEPGYYQAGEYGIRIENLVMVEPRGDQGWLGFEMLTHAPLERALLDQSMLSREEVAWWNTYHAKVLEIAGPQVEGTVRDWLNAACAPI